MKQVDIRYILNENNKPITKEFIKSVLMQFDINIEVKNLELFQEAMTHPSYLIRDETFFKSNKTKQYQNQSVDIEPLQDISKAMPLQKKSFERLEYVGDGVIHNVVAEYSYDRYEDEDEGFLTKLRTKIENGDTLAMLSRKIGLPEYALISRHVENNGNRDNNTGLAEDLFEAFIGALKKDSGHNVCEVFIIKLLEREIDFAQLLYQETNFKEKLLQYFHLKKWQDPVYGSLDVSGPENKKNYTMFVKCRKFATDEGEIIGMGVGSSKKIGEQTAAKQALIYLGCYKDDIESDEEILEYSDSDDL